MQAAAKNVKFHVQPVCRFMQLKRLQVGGALIETRTLTTITLPVTSPTYATGTRGTLIAKLQVLSRLRHTYLGGFPCVFVVVIDWVV